MLSIITKQFVCKIKYFLQKNKEYAANYTLFNIFCLVLCQSLSNFAHKIPSCTVSKDIVVMKIVFNYLFDIKKRRKFQDEKGLRVDRLNARVIAWASTYQTLGTSYGLLMR